MIVNKASYLELKTDWSSTCFKTDLGMTYQSKNFHFFSRVWMVKFGHFSIRACHPCAMGHANIRCIVPILLDVSEKTRKIIIQFYPKRRGIDIMNIIVIMEKKNLQNKVFFFFWVATYKINLQALCSRNAQSP